MEVLKRVVCLSVCWILIGIETYCFAVNITITSTYSYIENNMSFPLGCKTDVEPAGNASEFYVNNALAQTLRFYSGNCYIKTGYSQNVTMCPADLCNCSPTNYTLIYKNSSVENPTTFSCSAIFHVSAIPVNSTVLTIFRPVPVKTVDIQPIDSKFEVNIVQGKKQILNCTTNPSRPAAWIQWYLGNKNVTSNATLHTPQKNGTQLIASSTLEYTGNDNDHNKTIYCTAANIPGRAEISSNIITIYITVPVTSISILSTSNSKAIDIVEGDKHTFNCTTDASRPAAWIQWYIGENNVTSDATLQPPQNVGDKFKALSTLEYEGRNNENNNTIHCEAVNIDGGQAVSSEDIFLFIKVPVTAATITPAGIENVINIIQGYNQTFTCKTDPSRPAAQINWYLGTQNVTDIAKAQTPFRDGDKFVASSNFEYTWNDSDHNTSIHCEAVNIDGRQTVKSENKTISIIVLVTTAVITPEGSNSVIFIVQGYNQTFTCETGASRPASWIQWYIGTENVTSLAKLQKPTEQNGHKFKASSILEYTGNNTDHNIPVHCEAFNFVGQKTIKSENKTIFIEVPVASVTFSTTSTNNKIHILEGYVFNFTCISSLSRPPARVQWYIGEANVTHKAIQNISTHGREMSATESNLLYTGNENDHMKKIYCNADNKVGKTNSTTKNIYIEYGPKQIALWPNITDLRKQEHKDNITIYCNSTCRPTCTHYWIGPGYYSTRDGYLVLETIFRNNSGQYMCHANNTFGNITSSFVSLTVDYKPTVTNLMLVNNSSISENESATLRCEIDSHPLSSITWTNATGTLQTDTNVVESTYSITKAECVQTGIYNCSATNSINGETFSDTKDISLFVLCSARIDTRVHPILKTKIGVKKGGNLNITVFIIAYPNPNITWTFTNNDTGVHLVIPSTNRSRIFNHITTVEKDNMKLRDFGIYTLSAMNTVGKELIQAFEVLQQSKPDPPTDIFVKCAARSATVSWRSEFNGGDAQLFQILGWTHSLGSSKYTGNISDPGEKNIGAGVIDKLDTNTLYYFTVISQNIHGSTNSSEIANCTTNKETSNDPGFSYVIGSVAGTLSAVLIVLLALGGVYFVRRNKKRGDDRQPIQRNTANSDGDIDDLKDNILYESAGPDFVKENKSVGVEYAVVQKKGKTFHPVTEGDIQETPLYTDVKKKTKHQQKGHGNENVNTRKKKDGKPNEKKLHQNDVYENMEGKMKNDSSTKQAHKNKNKDGLQYADLVFNQSPNGAKFVIHGLEDRTIYAEVDTTQRIDPLPDSDDEDDDGDN